VPRCCHRSPRQPTLGADLGVADASTDDIYAAMDWLAGQQGDIEAKLARHLAPEPNPARMALFDLSSSWLKGTRCPLAARGYSRDGKKGRLQIARLLEEQVQAGMTGRRQPQSHHLGGQLGYQRLARGRGPREKDAQGRLASGNCSRKNSMLLVAITRAACSVSIKSDMASRPGKTLGCPHQPAKTETQNAAHWVP
jgi:hypothetical protein